MLRISATQTGPRGSELFIPLYEKHAIQEVVLTALLDRELDEKAIEAVQHEHPKFRAELPKVDRPNILEVMVGPSSPIVTPSLRRRPLSFTSFKRDGTIDWRLHLEDRRIAVNCLTYTRWEDVSGRAFTLMRHVANALRQRQTTIVQTGLQYIDIFKWREKTDKYDLGLLIRPDSPYMPSIVWEHRHRPLWHLHHGVIYPDDKLTAKGKTLHRVHCDAVLESGSHIVKIDSLITLDYSQPLGLREAIFDRDHGHVANSYGELHGRHKQMLLSILNNDMADRIGLTA